MGDTHSGLKDPVMMQWLMVIKSRFDPSPTPGWSIENDSLALLVA